MNRKSIFGGFLLLILAVGCATHGDSTVANAQFALDAGNYDEAITLATEAIAEGATDTEVYHILGSAYFGRSGLDFLDLEEAILNLTNDDTGNFRAIANALPSGGSLADLRLAIESLEAAPGITGDALGEGALADAGFDMALMKAIEHYALGIYGSSYHTSLDVTAITDAQATLAQADLISFDDNFTASGVSSTEDFIGEIRQTLCILEPISAAEGFTAAEFRALVGCQLDPDNFDPLTVTADVAGCAVLAPGSQTASVQACYDVNTTL